MRTEERAGYESATKHARAAAQDIRHQALSGYETGGNASGLREPVLEMMLRDHILAAQREAEERMRERCGAIAFDCAEALPVYPTGTMRGIMLVVARKIRALKPEYGEK